MSLINVDKMADSQGGVLAPISSVMRNRIINGAMIIDQRNAGASVTPGGGATYLVDRFSYISTQASKVSAQQVSVTTNGFTKALKFTSLSAYSSMSSDYLFIAQKIEGFNIADLNWGTANAKSITISFVVNSSLTGTFGGALINSAGSMNYVFSYSIPVANTDTTVSVTIPGPTSGTWLTNNGEGIQVRWNLGSGSSYLGTAGSWGATNFMGPTGAVSVAGTNAATWQITGVQLEKGTQATSFEYRQYGQELALCQRYFYNSYTWIISNSTGVNGNQYANGFHPVQMRANPTYALQSGSWTTSTPSLDGSTPLSYRLGSASSFFSGPTALISFSAEL